MGQNRCHLGIFKGRVSLQSTSILDVNRGITNRELRMGACFVLRLDFLVNPNIGVKTLESRPRGNHQVYGFQSGWNSF